MNKTKKFTVDTVFESDTVYVGTQKVYDIYPSDDMDNPNYYCEIWIAVNEK